MPDMPLLNGDPNSMPAPEGASDLPPVAGPEATNPLADAPAIGGPLELAPEQLEALNIADLAPGDSQTIVLKAQEASEGGPPTFEVVSSNPVLADDAEADAETSPETSPVAPEEEPEPVEGDDVAGGFVRKKKEPRAGLPDTKKMRDL